MSHAATLVRLLPLALLARVAMTLTQIVVAVIVVTGSVVLGHDLRDWRAWYAEPGITHPWAPTAKPSAVAQAASGQTAAPVATPTAATTQLVVAATPPPACRTSTGADQLAFVRPFGMGADCVWLSQRADGTHVVVETNGYATSDLGIVAVPHSDAELRAFAPADWSSPVLVVTGSADGDTASVVVISWQARRVVELFRAGGKRLEVSSDGRGWPRIVVTSTDGAVSRVHTYAWNGSAFAAR